MSRKLAQMPSDYILGMGISASIGVIGTLAMAYINYRRTTMEQKAENQRIRAELMAEKEAEAIQGLSIELAKKHSLYDTAVRQAANNTMNLVKYEEEISGQYIDFQTSMQEAMVFLSSDGEAALREYFNEMIGAEMYVGWKADKGGPFLERHPKKAIREEELPSHIDFDWNRFQKSYQLAKEGLRYDVRKRMKPLKGEGE